MNGDDSAATDVTLGEKRAKTFEDQLDAKKLKTESYQPVKDLMVE